MNRLPAGSPRGASARAATRPGDLTRWRLLKAAIRIFADKGFQGTSTREITQAAGVNIALICFHFGGKDGLYREALRCSKRLAERMVASLPDVPGAGEPGPGAETALRALSGMILRAALPGPGRSAPGRGLGRAAVAFVTREMARPRAGAEAPVAEAARPVAAYLERCVRALRPDLDEEARAWLILGLESLLVLPVSHPGLLAAPRASASLRINLEALTSHILDTALTGMAHPPGRAAVGQG